MLFDRICSNSFDEQFWFVLQWLLSDHQLDNSIQYYHLIALMLFVIRFSPMVSICQMMEVNCWLCKKLSVRMAYCFSKIFFWHKIQIHLLKLPINLIKILFKFYWKENTDHFIRILIKNYWPKYYKYWSKKYKPTWYTYYYFYALVLLKPFYTHFYLF